MLFWGLEAMLLGGGVLAAQRFPAWSRAWRWACGVVLVWLISLPFSEWESEPEEDNSGSSREQSWQSFELKVVFPGAVILGVLSTLSDRDGTAFAMGLTVAALNWAKGKYFGRHYPVATAAWFLSGALSSWVAWPNPQRCALVFVVGGLGTMIQGAWEILWFAHGRRLPPSDEATAASPPT